MVIFGSRSVLGEVKAILYIQIYTKLSIKHWVHFFYLLNTGRAQVFHINVLAL